VIARLLKFGSWGLIGLGVLGVIGWAFSVRTLSDIGPLGALVSVWLGVLGWMKANRLANAPRIGEHRKPETR